MPIYFNTEINILVNKNIINTFVNTMLIHLQPFMFTR